MHRTRSNKNLHLPIANLTKYTKGAYFSGMKVYNYLPEYIKTLSMDQKHFKYTAQKFFYVIVLFIPFKNTMTIKKIHKNKSYFTYLDL